MVVDGEEEYEVEAILRHKGKGARCLYLVMWKGYPITEARWEPESNLQNAPLILKDYLHHVKAKEQRWHRNIGTRRRFDGASEEYEAIGEFAAEGPVLVGGLRVGDNHVWRAEPTWMVL